MSISQGELQKLASLSSRSAEEASLILNGEIIDSWLIKILINIENKTGAMLVLVSELSFNLVSVYSIFGTSPAIRKIRTFEKFDQFSQDMVNAIKEGGIETAVSERIGRTIYRILTPEDMKVMVPAFDSGNVDSLVELISKGVAKETKLLNIQVELDIERINTVAFAKNNPIYGLVAEVRSPFDTASPTNTASSSATTSSKTSVTNSSVPKTKVEVAIDDFVKDYKEIVKCSTVVSPVSGVLFDDLKPGQKLLFVLPFKTPDDKARARRLGAVDKLGQNGPVVGEFVKLIMGKDEYHLFAKGPNNVLLRAFEERPVRLAVPKNVDYEGEEERNIKTIVLVALGFLLFVLALFFFYFR